MIREMTPVEAQSSQIELEESPKDTPRSVVETRLGLGHAFVAFAASTQILNPSYSGMNDYALVSRNMTGFSEEEVVQEFGESETDEEIFGTERAIRMASGEVANRDRLALLARSYVVEQLSPEENARLAIVTERVRQLIPRVTTEDFEQLEQIARDIERIDFEDSQRRRRLGIG